MQSRPTGTAAWSAACAWLSLFLLLIGCGGGSGGPGSANTNTPSGYPAFTPPFPQVISYLATPQIIKNPVFIPVFFVNTPNQATTVHFLQQMVTSAFWQEVNQYGVQTATIASPINLSISAPLSTVEAQIDAFVQASAPTWTPSPTGSEIYILYYPNSTSITDFKGGGYHWWTKPPATPVSYAVIPIPPPGYDYSYVQFHEAAEAATDPTGNGYFFTNQGYLAWSNTGFGTEIGDLCVFSPFFYSGQFSPDVPMKNLWSDTSAAAGRDPCAGSASAVPTFGAVPIMPGTLADPFSMLNSAALNTESVVQISPGTSKTVSVRLFSYGPLPAPITVSAMQTYNSSGSTGTATLSLDKTTGNNGDTIQLTITAPTTPLTPDNTGVAYISFSLVATTTSANGQTTYYGLPFPALVIN